MAHVNTYWYHKSVSLLREFFVSKGFLEVHAQSRPTLLSACDDPSTITTYEYGGEKWLLPQSTQITLESELLQHPDAPGFFCCSTSYRQEKDPVPGRHERVFPIFEFETHGDVKKLQELEEELLAYLGFEEEKFAQGAYEIVAAEFGVSKVTDDVETKIGKNKAEVFFLHTFPEEANPTWDMKRDGAYARKIDVILYGVETIGSAERSCDVEQMRQKFHTLHNGEYAKALFDLFGEKRVERELEQFLAQPFIPRCGGSIGVTRLIRALKLKESAQRREDMFSPVQSAANRLAMEGRA